MQAATSSSSFSRKEFGLHSAANRTPVSIKREVMCSDLCLEKIPLASIKRMIREGKNREKNEQLEVTYSSVSNKS